MPPRAWTTESLWRAYAQLEKDKVRGANARRVLTDIVSLVRHAVQLDDELIPFPERVQARYREWLETHEKEMGRSFTPEERKWLDQIAEHIGVNVSVTRKDLDMIFLDWGGQVAATRVFGKELNALLEDLNLALVA